MGSCHCQIKQRAHKLTFSFCRNLIGHLQKAMGISDVPPYILFRRYNFSHFEDRWSCSWGNVWAVCCTRILVQTPEVQLL